MSLRRRFHGRGRNRKECIVNQIDPTFTFSERTSNASTLLLRLISHSGSRTKVPYRKSSGALSNLKRRFMKNREIYLMPRSTATITQSGLLAALLRRQRHKALELGQCLAHSEQLSSAFSTTLPWPLTRAHGANVGRRCRRGFGRTLRMRT